MKNKYSLKLIDGNFTTAEAREVLVNVFSSKIQFHQSKNFSSEERFGKQDEIALKRIPELKSSLQQIMEIFSVASASNCSLSIKSEVSIVISQPRQLSNGKKRAATASEKESVVNE